MFFSVEQKWFVGCRLDSKEAGYVLGDIILKPICQYLQVDVTAGNTKVIHTSQQVMALLSLLLSVED